MRRLSLLALLSSALLFTAAGCVIATPAATGAGPATTPTATAGMEPGIDRPGEDYRHFDLPSPDPGACQRACAREARCVAWTYVKPGVQAPAARCWLKGQVPPETHDACCVSGVK